VILFGGGIYYSAKSLNFPIDYKIIKNYSSEKISMLSPSKEVLMVRGNYSFSRDGQLELSPDRILNVSWLVKGVQIEFRAYSDHVGKLSFEVQDGKIWKSASSQEVQNVLNRLRINFESGEDWIISLLKEPKLLQHEQDKIVKYIFEEISMSSKKSELLRELIHHSSFSEISAIAIAKNLDEISFSNDREEVLKAIVSRL
jgi:hypothetical protein